MGSKKLKIEWIYCLLGMITAIIMGPFFNRLPISKKIVSALVTPIPTPTLTPTTTPTPTSTPTPTPTLTPTPTQTPTLTPLPTAIPVISYEAYFDQYSTQYQVSKELLKKIALCESGMNPNSVNGDYVGLYQFSTSTWQVTRTAMELDTNANLRFNPEESIRTAAYKIINNGQNAWKNCL